MVQLYLQLRSSTHRQLVQVKLLQLSLHKTAVHATFILLYFGAMVMTGQPSINTWRCLWECFCKMVIATADLHSDNTREISQMSFSVVLYI